MFLQGKVNSAPTLHRLFNPRHCHFFDREGDVLFQQDNSHPHTAAEMIRGLPGVQYVPWLARYPVLSLIEHVWDMMKWEITLPPEPTTTITELRQRVQDAWDNLSRTSAANSPATTTPEDVSHSRGRNFEGKESWEWTTP